MRLVALTAAALLAGASLSAQVDPLRVLRHTPDDIASPESFVTITFDRPVAGSLDQSVEAAKIFRIEPGVEGTVRWRDPVTVRFIPKDPLPPGTRFRVTIDNAFRALDGSRLPRPYRFGFRVRGPRLLAQSVGPLSATTPVTLPLDGKIQLHFSAPVDLDVLRKAVRVELPRCEGARKVQLIPVRQRPVASDDRYYIPYNGPGRGVDSDRFQRVVELEPAIPMPPDCSGALVIPTTADDRIYGREERFLVNTAPRFRLKASDCGARSTCAHRELVVEFTAPITRADAQRYVHVEPSLPLTLDEGLSHAHQWRFNVRLAPRSTYTVTVDEALRDIHGRSLVGPRQLRVTTRDFAPAIDYPRGSLIMTRTAPPTIPVRHVNVRSVRVITYRVPERLRARLMSVAPALYDTLLKEIAGVRPDTAILPIIGRFNVDTTTEVSLPRSVGNTPGSLIALRIEIASTFHRPDSGGIEQIYDANLYLLRYRTQLALLQITSLAAHARVAPGDGSVLVTGIVDARPREGAIVRQLTPAGTVIAEGRTDREGIAHLRVRGDADADRPRNAELPVARTWPPRAGLIEAVVGDDRVMVPLGVHALGYAPFNPLDPSRLGGRHEDAPPATAAVFTDRGIYRPGEMLYLKGVIRVGPLGSLTALTARDSARLTVTYQGNAWDSEDDVVIRDTVLPSTEFGTVADSLVLRAGLPLGTYDVALHINDRGSWQSVAEEEVRVAEYRAPEFLVEARADSTPRYVGDTITVRATARYLFGSPMARAIVRWRALLHRDRPWEMRIPGSDGWIVGEWTSDDTKIPPNEVHGVDTLGANGQADIRIPVAELLPSHPGRLEVHVAVGDITRQVVTTSTAVPVHPASVYILARHRSKGGVWTAGRRTGIDVRTVRPDGATVSGVPVVVSVVRKRWENIAHGLGSYGRWREDTLRSDTLRTGEQPVPYSLVPETPGWYELRLSAEDHRGARARTTVQAWAMGGPVSRWGESPLRLLLVADRDAYAVGDQANVMFDSPFEEAEAWVTVERERVHEHRRLVVRRGSNTVSLGITERHAPNVFVSVLLLNATPHDGRPDSTAALLRVGYAELRVGVATKRLTVTVSPRSGEYRPRDTAELRVQVRDAQGRGVRSEVTLWAVDEGVLALSGFETPDVLERLYRRRGLGAALWSAWPMLLTADPALFVELTVRGEMRLSAIVAGNAAFQVEAYTTSVAQEPAFLALRSQFRSTAFFLASVVTDESGTAVARAALPDNLTTYRVMAAAVSGGDRFGSGDTTLLVTRPLVTRPTLPRFVRAGDSLLAGAAVNARDGRSRAVEVRAVGEGISIDGAPHRSIALSGEKGAEARFRFIVPDRGKVRDTVVVRVGATDGTHEDAVETRLAVRPDFHPRMHARLGTVRDSTEITIALPGDIDPTRSRLSLRVGISPLAPMLAAYDRLRVYPYDCTEQIVSAGRALIAVWRAAGEAAPVALGGDPRPRLQVVADELARRQASGGGIRFWRDHDWTTPWLSTYAGLFLLEAREMGITVDGAVLTRLAHYLRDVATARLDTGGMNRYERRSRRLLLGHRVAVVDFLRRFDAGERGAEDALLELAPTMTWEDRLRLAEVLASRGDAGRSARALVDAAWRAVRVAGRRVDLPDTAHSDREFPSRIAPAARLLTATLAIQPDHPLLGGLIETVLQYGRAERWVWNTQDYASVVNALGALSDKTTTPREVQVLAGASTVLSRRVGGADSSASVPLVGLLEQGRDGQLQLRLKLRAVAGTTPVYYAVLVEEIPSRPPVRPDIEGVVVERWYERFADGRAVTTVQEGELVRVRLRITVPSDRHFLAVEDPLPAGLEPIDLSLRTSGTLDPFMIDWVMDNDSVEDGEEEGPWWQAWLYGRWEEGRWSPWEHKAIHDDRVVYFARMLWPGAYTASYVARATTAGKFVRPPAHAEEMYNPALHGRSDGGSFSVMEARP